MLRQFLLLIFIFSFLGCKTTSLDNPNSLIIPESNQYAVYQALITDGQFGIYYRTIAIYQYTKESAIYNSHVPDLLKNNLPLLQDETIKDYKIKNN